MNLTMYLVQVILNNWYNVVRRLLTEVGVSKIMGLDASFFMKGKLRNAISGKQKLACKGKRFRVWIHNNYIRAQLI